MGFFFPFSVIFPSFPACQSWFFSSSHSFSLPAGHDRLFPLSHAPLGSVFLLFLFIFPFLRGMFASFLTLMPRSALFSFFSSSLFPARGACLLFFSLSCPAPLCFSCFSSSLFPARWACLPLSTLQCPAPLYFPSFPLHFPLPAGHVCSFSLSHAPLGSVFSDCLLSDSCQGIRSAV